MIRIWAGRRKNILLELIVFQGILSGLYRYGLYDLNEELMIRNMLLNILYLFYYVFEQNKIDYHLPGQIARM